MRNYIILGFFVSWLLSLTACMGDGGNTIHYHRVGVVREQPMRCVYTTDDKGGIFIVSSPDFEQREELKDGDCCAIDFKTDFSEELGNGVYKAEIYKYDSVAVWPTQAIMTDTATVLKEEKLFKLHFMKTLYLDGHLFLQTEHQQHWMAQQETFHLTYDPQQEVEVGEEGMRIYNLFLRASQKYEPTDSLERPVRWLNTTAFQVSEFLEQAKAAEMAAGQNALNLKINYVDHFNADTTACTWTAGKVFTLRFTN